VSVAQDANEDFRSYMEDGHHVADPVLQRGSRGKEEQWGFFGVYDGHGGRKEVDYVEAKLHDVVLAELRGLPLGKDIHQAVRSALVCSFKKIDDQLAMLGAWESGCTCTVMLLQRHERGLTLHVANVGDSRAVLVGSAGSKRLSVDHRASDPAETKRIQQEGGIVRHGRVGGQLSVSRSLGDHRLKSSGVSCVPDVCSCELSDEYAVVIASDGLWDALEDDDVRVILGSCIDAALVHGKDQQTIADYLRQHAARTLVETAKERGSRDNILALVAFF
jgi:serine/threonine protein phosphatase PrpC